MNYLLTFILLISATISILGQSYTHLHIDLFRPTNLKSVSTYYKSRDTVKHPENNNQIFLNKTEYFKNGVKKSDLKINYLANNPHDTGLYIIYALNLDSTIKSEKIYSSSEKKWKIGGVYKYNTKSKYQSEIRYSKKSKIEFEYDNHDKLIRERDFSVDDFTLNDYIYDSLGRLKQWTFYPGESRYNRSKKRHERQSFFVFKYHYDQHADSLFCTEDQYIFDVNVKTWDKLRSESPKEFNIKDTTFNVQLFHNYKIIVFNNRQEIIYAFDCWRNENPSYPYKKTWTRWIYVYEYY